MTPKVEYVETPYTQDPFVWQSLAEMEQQTKENVFRLLSDGTLTGEIALAEWARMAAINQLRSKLTSRQAVDQLRSEKANQTLQRRL